MNASSPPSAGKEIPIHHINGKSIIQPGEALTHKNCDRLNACFDTLTQQGEQDIVLDFNRVHFLDSRVLESLIDVQNKLAGLNGTLSLSNVNEVCRDILISVRVINRFPIISGHRTTGSPKQ